MASGRVARGEKMLASMENKLGLTPEGKEWIIGALDPYHDTPLKVCGYPDGNTQPIATQVIKNSYNLSCPAGITTGTWDVMIIATPFAKSVKLANGSKLGGTNSNPTNEVATLSTGTVNVNVGGMTNIIVPSGGSFNLSNNPPSATTVVTNFGLADQYLQGISRIIGKGFEVHNTTAELNIQGMATTFSVPLPDLAEAGEYQCYTVTTAGPPGALVNASQASVLPIEMWPSTQSQAVLTPGSRQWTAKQGCYLTPKLKNLDIPATDTGFPIQPFVVGGDSSNFSQNLGSVLNPSIVANGAFVYPNVFWDNFDMVGVIFSGLSLSSTLTVNYTYIVERQPDYTISDLVVLAVPPPERDNVALDLYTHLSDHLPIGVPVAENGLGDWFANALSTAADFVAPVLSAVPGVGGVIGNAIGMANSAYKRSKEPPKVFQTNPYVAPVPRPVGRAKEVIHEKPNGDVVIGVKGGSTAERIALRNKLAVRNIKMNNRAGAASRINPFKGKSIPR